MKDNDLERSRSAEEREMLEGFRGYLSECRENGRLATLAGFRASKMISSRRYERFAREHEDAADMIRSVLIDEAVNFKSANPAANIRCVLSVADGIEEDEMTVDVEVEDGE